MRKLHVGLIFIDFSKDQKEKIVSAKTDADVLAVVLERKKRLEFISEQPIDAVKITKELRLLTTLYGEKLLCESETFSRRVIL